MRGYLFLNDHSKKDKFFDACFMHTGKIILIFQKSENIKEILCKCKIDEKKYLTGIKDIKIKDKLKNLTTQAFDNDIFRSTSTSVVNDKLFWGQDRLDYALEEYNS